jgi:hypothetical protein
MHVFLFVCMCMFSCMYVCSPPQGWGVLEEEEDEADQNEIREIGQERQTREERETHTPKVHFPVYMKA